MVGGSNNYYQLTLKMRKPRHKEVKDPAQDIQLVSGQVRLRSQVLWLLTSVKNLSKYRHAKEIIKPMQRKDFENEKQCFV